MSTILVDCSAALLASPRPRLSLAGERRYASDAQPRLLSRPATSAVMAWRDATATMRGFAPAAQDGPDAFAGAGFVTTTSITTDTTAAATKQQHLIRSGPPTSR